MAGRYGAGWGVWRAGGGEVSPGKEYANIGKQCAEWNLEEGQCAWE